MEGVERNGVVVCSGGNGGGDDPSCSSPVSRFLRNLT